MMTGFINFPGRSLINFTRHTIRVFTLQPEYEIFSIGPFFMHRFFCQTSGLRHQAHAGGSGCQGTDGHR